MDINKIKTVLSNNKSDILSKSGKQERLDAVIRVLNKSFPRVSEQESVYGPITNLVACEDRFEIDKIIDGIQSMKEISGECLFINLNSNYGDILAYIQDFIA